jgi:hypothetical protein
MARQWTLPDTSHLLPLLQLMVVVSRLLPTWLQLRPPP